MRYPLLDVFITIMWLFLWNLWVFLVIRIVFDSFFGHDNVTWGKAGLKDLGVIAESDFQPGEAKVLT